MKAFLRSLMPLTFVTLSVAVALPAAAQTADPPAATPQTAPAVKQQPVDIFQGAGVLLFKTQDESFKLWLDGRIQLDAASYFKSDTPMANGAEIRRARFGFNMVYSKNWAAQFDVDFADNAVEMKDMWIAYTGFRDSSIRAGNFKMPFGLESLISSRYISFIERPMIDNFTPDRHMAVAYSHWGDRWQASGAGFVQIAGTTDETGQDQGYGFAGRVTGLPYQEGDSLVHVGFAASYLKPDAPVEADLSDANEMRFRARPETHVNRARFVDTKTIGDVDHSNLIGVEAAGIFGRLSMQSEYNRDMVIRLTDSGKPNATFDGWYAHAAYFLTNDHRPYDKSTGELDRVLPSGPNGAVEVLARYSTINLNDTTAGIKGGEQKITTLGLNWYVNANVRLMTNYSFVRGGDNAKGDKSFNILQARFQLAF